MKKILCSLISISMLTNVVWGQDNNDDDIQPPTLGVHFTLHDFASAANIRNSSLSAALKNQQFGKISDMNSGLAINFINGINQHFDYSLSLGGSFLEYPFRNKPASTSDHFLLETTAMVRGKMTSNKYWLNPYLQAGVGAASYDGYYGAFIPIGAGMQVNLQNQAFLLINMQYRVPVTQLFNYHFLFSIGIAGKIADRKQKMLPPPPPPPPPKDTDGDGIVDSLDACPDVAGLQQFNGCPDTDGDGIADKDDKCPNEKGLARYQGCPIPDRDGDGINDEEDKCPDVKGEARYQGCPIPDTDGDGVNDEVDKCPNLPGTVANNGCPEVKAEVLQRVEVAARSIYFTTGSAKLMSKSAKSLDEVVQVLTDDPNLKIDIEGHTDNTGNADKNLALSEERANAVMNYLSSKGIDSSRITSKGFGQEQPIADNKTAAGRTKNRRVELKLHYN